MVRIIPLSAMTGRIARSLLLLVAGAAPALAGGLPEHPPAPPPRPVFDSDPAPAPDQAQPAETQPETQPEAQAAAPYNPVPPPPEARVDRPRPPYDPRPTEPAPAGFEQAENAGLADLTRKYAERHGVPLALLHRIIMRESRYHPRLVNRSFYGLMQINPATAHAMGYAGAPKGLLDAETNLAYATPYLANAWALADGDMDRAVRLYAAGYYYTAKAKHMLGAMRTAHSPPVKPQPPEPASLAAPPPAQPETGFFGSLFAPEPSR